MPSEGGDAVWKNAEGVGKFQPRVASTLGNEKQQRINAESVRPVVLTPSEFETFGTPLLPGLKQPWAEISQRFRR